MAHPASTRMTSLHLSVRKYSLFTGKSRCSPRQIVPCLLMALALPGAPCAAQSTLLLASRQEAAVAQARAGDAQGALEILRNLLKQNSQNTRLLADTAIIAGWAGDDSLVLELYSHPGTPRSDFDLTTAAAHAARNLHFYDRALDLYRHTELLSPDRWQARLGEAMVLTDMGSYKDAAALIQPILRDHPQDPDAESGEAYLCLRENDFACAIDMDLRRSSQMPHEAAEIEDQMAHALTGLGGDTLARSTWHGSDLQEKLRLQADLGAERVRWATADRAWEQRQTDAGEALTMLDQVIAATKPGDPIWKQAQSDRLLALADLNRAVDVVRSFELLQQLKIDVPDYAVLPVADAYLAVHNPRRAESLYRSLAGRLPHNHDLWAGLAYAQFEREHTGPSFTTIDRAWSNAPPMLQAKNLRAPQNNQSNTDFGLQAAQMRGFADLPNQEQERLIAMLAAAPANANLNRAIAMTYLARGWPLRAIRQERIADSFEQPDDLPTIEDAQVLEQAGQRDRADALLRPLLDREGTNPPMVRYLHDRAIEHGWQSDVHSGFEWSSGRFIGTTQSSEAHLYTPLFDNRWRAYVHGWGDNGKFQGGATYRSRGAVGMSFDYDRNLFWAEAGADQNPAEARLGVAAGAHLSLGDRWTVGIKGDTDDFGQVQLIASLANIHARSIDFSLDRRQSDLSSVSMGFDRLLFTDGNQRTVFSGSWNERVWSAPHLQINISPQIWTSFNSEDQNRIYFNPKRDLSAGALTTLRWITWRRYEQNLTQQITVFAAPSWQQNYGTGTAVATSYMQNWAISHRLEAFGKFTWNSQRYDGSNEPYTNLMFGISWGIQ